MGLTSRSNVIVAKIRKLKENIKSKNKNAQEFVMTSEMQ
jgi:hypothetical protein